MSSPWGHPADSSLKEGGRGSEPERGGKTLLPPERGPQGLLHEPRSPSVGLQLWPPSRASEGDSAVLGWWAESRSLGRSRKVKRSLPGGWGFPCRPRGPGVGGSVSQRGAGPPPRPRKPQRRQRAWCAPRVRARRRPVRASTCPPWREATLPLLRQGWGAGWGCGAAEWGAGRGLLPPGVSWAPCPDPDGPTDFVSSL